MRHGRAMDECILLQYAKDRMTDRRDAYRYPYSIAWAQRAAANQIPFAFG